MFSSLDVSAASSWRSARPQQLFHQRLRSNLASAIGGMLDVARLQEASLIIAALLDWLWLRKAVADDIARDEAIILVFRGICSW